MKLATARTAVVILGLLAAIPAQAARPHWSFVELGYLDSDRGNTDQEAIGARLSSSISLQRWMYFTGEYSHADYKDSDVQQRDTSIGLGTHTNGRNWQLYGAATYERSDLFTTDFTDEGYAMQFGVRWPIIKELEVAADVKWYQMNRAEHINRHRATAQWRFGPTWAVVGTFQRTSVPADSITDFTIGFRAYFKTQYDLPLRRAPATH